MSPVWMAFGAGIVVGILGTKASAWAAAKARILDLQHQQDQERAEWHTRERWRQESDRLAYGVGDVGAVTELGRVLTTVGRRKAKDA